ncbi:MAG: oligosaccharide flippase family protein [Oscillospiraceae bacterium]|nr:oligosaccharide flippase family protein [Oscillospiraceae bacterium]
MLKSSIWYTASNFATRALGFITIPIFSRLLSTAEFGGFNVFANWQSILLTIVGLEIYGTVNKARFDYSDESSFSSYVFTCLVLSTAITGTLLAVYLLFADTIDKLLLMDRRYVYIMFAYLFTKPAFEMFQAEQRVKYKYKLSATISFASLILSTLLALVLTVMMPNDRLTGRIAGQYIPYFFIGLAFYIYYISRSHVFSWEKCRYAFKIAIPLVFSYLGSHILVLSDKIVVQHLSTDEAVAYLSLATSCSHIMLFFVRSLNNAWSPWFYDKLAAGEEGSINRLFRRYLWFVIFCTVGVLLLGPEIVWLLGDKSYGPSISLLPVNMLCGGFTLIVSQYTAFETFYNKPHYSAIVTGITAIINVVIDIIGVKLFGYTAACYATVLCFIILILFHLIITRKMGIFRVFPLKDLAVEVAAMLLLIPISLSLYRVTVVRYIALALFSVALVVVLYKYRHRLLSLLKKK